MLQPLSILIKQLRLKYIQKIIYKYYNKHYLDIIFNKDDTIMLKYTNIKTQRSFKKLNYKKLGLYIIYYKISNIVYKLNLSIEFNIQ